MNIQTILITTFIAFGVSGCSDPIPALYQSGVQGPQQVGSGVDLQPGEPMECTSDGGCDDGNPCTEDRCDAGLCRTIPINSGACCVSEILFAEDFDGLAADLSQTTLHGSIGWGVSKVRAKSAPASVHFGDEVSGSYATGERVAASMSLPVLDLPSDRDSRLELQIFTDIEPANEYDRFQVQASVLEGASVVETVDLLTKSNLPTKAFKDFTTLDVDLAKLRGKRIKITFVFDSMDEMNNAFEGVFMDDIRVILGCPDLAVCQVDEDCEDGDACTVDACSEQGCVALDVCEELPQTDAPSTGEPGTDEPGTDEPGTDEPGTDEPGTDEPGTDEPGTDEPGTDEPGTDEPGSDEPGTDEPGTDEPGTDEPGSDEPGTDEPGTDEPGTDEPGSDEPGSDEPGSDEPGGDPDTPSDNINPCEQDDAPENCCLSKVNCDDGNPMTVDTCEGGSCVWTPNPDACQSDSDCEDEEACTTEVCVEGLCQFNGAVDALCCEESSEPLFNFDNGKLQGMFVTDNLATGVFWGTEDSFATTGDYGLSCVDPLVGGYDVGKRVKSSATTPILEIPVGGMTTLRFDLRKITRSNPNVDVFEVLVLREGALTQAFSSKGLPQGQTGGGFQVTDVSLAAYAGQSIQIRFVFDSVNAPEQFFDGATIDSLELLTSCE
jgi:hypothetical protein